MNSEIYPVNKEALLREIRGKKVYVNPFRGTVSSRPSSGSIGVPKTRWWGEGSAPNFPSSFSLVGFEEIIANEIIEMSIYFPDFDLYRDEEGNIFWLGKIDGIGEVKVTYPKTYPAQKFLIEALDLEESFNEELRRTVWSYDDITPAGALIVLMRLFLLRRFSGSGIHAMV